MNEKEKKVTQTNEGKKEQPKNTAYNGAHPEQLHCRRCQTLMEEGTCPACGFKIYVPMSEEKRKKIKTITTAIGFVVFIVIFLVIQFSKS
jgi:uncharacterized paraquat-inducible protein A